MNKMISFMPGINTNYDKMNSHLDYLTPFTQGIHMCGVNNRDHGLLLNGIEVLSLNLNGISPNTAEGLMAKWTAFHNENRDNPFAKILHICHSQGAAHTKNALEALPKEIRDRVLVLAIAPLAIVSKEICGDSLNIASDSWDIVHDLQGLHGSFVDMFAGRELTDGMGLRSALELRNELFVIPSHPDASWFDHSFQSPTYAEIIRRVIEDYITHNGEYHETVRLHDLFNL